MLSIGIKIVKIDFFVKQDNSSFKLGIS